MRVEEKEFDILIDGVRLRCYQAQVDSALPTIIFLHESFGCIEHWRDFPCKLGENTGLNILVYDRQGYGQSDPFTVSVRENDYMEKEAEVLDEIIRQLDLNDVVLFGHSDGGTIALIEAALYKEKIKAVITEGAHLFVEEITLEGIRQAEKAYYDSDLKKKLARYQGDKAEMLFRLWADTWKSERFRNWNIEYLLKEITCPVFVIQGIDDEYGTIRQVESIENNTIGYSRRYMPKTGHTPHRESPKELIAEVTKFLISQNIIT